MTQSLSTINPPFAVKNGLKVYDTIELDSLLLQRYPDAHLEEGCQFARWLVFDRLMTGDEAADVITVTFACNHYSGTCMSRTFTAFFLCDRFSS